MKVNTKTLKRLADKLSSSPVVAGALLESARYIEHLEQHATDDIAELESAHKMMAARNERLQKENDDLAEALRFYADEDNWIYGKVQHVVRGEKAREVLRKYGLDGEEE